MKILYHKGNIHFIDVAGKNWVIPDGTEGEEDRNTILIMAQYIWENIPNNVEIEKIDSVSESGE